MGFQVRGGGRQAASRTKASGNTARQYQMQQQNEQAA